MNNAGSGLEQALEEATSVLDAASVPYMLIGGLALAAWNLPRATLDVDLTLWAPGDRFEGVCRLLAGRFVSRVMDPWAFAQRSRVLPVTTKAGVRIDFVFAAFPFEKAMIERASSRQFGALPVRVASLEDLILLKLPSGRPKDRQDIERIVGSYREQINWDYLLSIAAQLAEALESPAMVEDLQQLRRL